MTPIRATDEITVPESAEQVWRVLADVGGYARWWPASIGLRVVSGGAELLGTEVEIRPGRGRPFRCRVEAVEKPRLIRTRYYGGFIEGHGEWRLVPSGSGTRVVYDLDVQASGWLVRLLSRFIDLGGVHSRQMQGVFRGLERALAREPAL